MKDIHTVILNEIKIYLEKNQDIRFSQMLFDLNINEFADNISPEKKDFLLRDIYSDSDEDVLKRIQNNIEE